MLAEIAGMIDAVGLQIGACDRDFGTRCLRQHLGGDIVDGAIGDFMNEAEVLVFAGGDARDRFAPGDLGVDDRLAPAPSIVDHHDEILHGALFLPKARRLGTPSHHFGKSETSQVVILKIRKIASECEAGPGPGENQAPRAALISWPPSGPTRRPSPPPPPSTPSPRSPTFPPPL